MAFDPLIVSGSNKLTLTLDSSAISTDATDFPLAVYLDGTNPLHGEIFTELGANSKRLSIDVAGSQCPVEVESWDSVGGLAVLHTKIPEYTSASDLSITLSFDNSQPDNTSYVGATGSAIAQTVWDVNYAMTQTMAQDPSGTAPQMIDSAGNFNGTSSGTMISDDLVDANFGKAIDFDGTDDFINVADGLSGLSFIQNSLVFTIDMHCAMDALDDRGVVLGSTPTSTEKGILFLWENSVGFGDRSWRLLVVQGVSGTPVIDVGSPENATINDNDYHVTTVRGTGTSVDFFVDGQQVATTILTAFNALSTGDSTRTAHIGDSNDATANLVPFDGKIGAVRVASVARSDDWIALTHLSLTDQLITWSTGYAPAERWLVGINTLRIGI